MVLLCHPYFQPGAFLWLYHFLWYCLAPKDGTALTQHVSDIGGSRLNSAKCQAVGQVLTVLCQSGQTAESSWMLPGARQTANLMFSHVPSQLPQASVPEEPLTCRGLCIGLRPESPSDANSSPPCTPREHSRERLCGEKSDFWACAVKVSSQVPCRSWKEQLTSRGLAGGHGSAGNVNYVPPAQSLGQW